MKTAAPEKKSVKTLKGQLFGAVSMMLVAAIALGTSTYAWFINNRTVEVQNMQLEVSTSTSMLVALEKYDSTAGGGNGAYTGYKSVIVTDDIKGATGSAADYAGWTEFFNQNMVPASITDANLKIAAPAFYATNNHVNNGKLDEFELVAAVDATTAGKTTYGLGQGPVKKLGLRFVGSNDLDVYLSKKDVADTIASLITPNITQAMVDDGDINPATGKACTAADLTASIAQAKAIRASLRVSIVAQQTGLDAAGVAAPTAYPAIDMHTFQFDNGKPFVGTNANNTDYNGQAENTNEEQGTYTAISTLNGKKIGTVGALNAMVTGYGTTTNADKTMLVVGADGSVADPASDSIKLFQLTKDVARDVDVYIWLEGTDQDCLNSISGYFFNLKLPFAAVLTPVTPPAP